MDWSPITGSGQVYDLASWGDVCPWESSHNDSAIDSKTQHHNPWKVKNTKTQSSTSWLVKVVNSSKLL